MTSFELGNARDNKTWSERQYPQNQDYTLPLTFWREAPRVPAQESTLWFRRASDRQAFAATFEANGYKTRDGIQRPWVSDRVQNTIGHWFDVIEVNAGGYQLRVQPLTMVGTTLRPFGPPVWVFRSDLRLS